MARALIVVRHAKAVDPSLRDFDRILADRGRRDSTRLGGWLGSRDLQQPVRAYVSGAARAQETWGLVSAGLTVDVETHVVDDLYGAGVDEARETVALTPAAIATVIMVGHNPTMAGLVHELAGERTPASAALERRGFPTAACALLELGSWDATSGALLHFVAPEDY